MNNIVALKKDGLISSGKSWNGISICARGPDGGSVGDEGLDNVHTKTTTEYAERHWLIGLGSCLSIGPIEASCSELFPCNFELTLGDPRPYPRTCLLYVGRVEIGGEVDKLERNSADCEALKIHSLCLMACFMGVTNCEHSVSFAFFDCLFTTRHL